MDAFDVICDAGAALQEEGQVPQLDKAEVPVIDGLDSLDNDTTKLQFGKDLRLMEVRGALCCCELLC